MHTVINSNTGQEIMGHNLFRVSGIYPNDVVGENEQIVFVPETLGQQLKAAYECTISADGEGVATGIVVTKTIEQWRQENPPAPQPLTEIEILRLEQAQSNAEMIDLMMSMLGGM